MRADRDEKKELGEAFDEVILQKACELYLDDTDEYQELLKETLSGETHQFSQRHEAQMKKLLASADKKKRTHFSRKAIRWIGIAAAVTILFFGSSGMNLVIDADWRDFRNFFLRRESTHTEITFPEKIGVEYWQILKDTGWENAYYPTYMPSDFILVDVLATPDICRMEFSYSNKTIKISQSLLQYGSFLYIDTEDASVTPLEINGYRGEYIEKADKGIIFFKTEDHYVSVEGNNISQKKLLKVTKNLKMLENAK